MWPFVWITIKFFGTSLPITQCHLTNEIQTEQFLKIHSLLIVCKTIEISMLTCHKKQLKFFNIFFDSCD